MKVLSSLALLLSILVAAPSLAQTSNVPAAKTESPNAAAATTASEPAAASKYADLIARSAALTDVQKKQALDLFSSGFKLWQSGDCTSAVIAFTQGLDIDPANGPANFYYGDCLARKGDKAGASDYLSRAIALATGKPEQFKAQAALQALATAPAAPSTPDEPQTTLAGDFVQKPFEGLWIIKASAWGVTVPLVWKISIDGNNQVHVVGGGFVTGFGEQTFKAGKVEGNKITLEWGGAGFPSTFEGTLLDPNHIQGQFHEFIASGSWTGEKQ